MIISGDDNILFPASKTFKLLMDEGIAVHHIPLQSSFLLNGEAILKQYHQAFGEDRVRVDNVEPGSTLIVARKNGELPKSPPSEAYLATHLHGGALHIHEFLTFY